MSSRTEAGRKLARATVVAVIAALAIPGRAAAAVDVAIQPPNPIAGQTTVTAQVTTTVPAASLAYQWLRCSAPASCTPIAGGTNAAYAVGTRDVGFQLSVLVTATYADTTTEAGQALTAAVRAAPRVTRVAISGRARVGQTLVASATATGYPPPDVTYQWLRCADPCSPIAGATQPSYTITDGDAGYRLAVEVTAQNELGADTGSDRTDRVPALPDIVALTIVGNPAVGETLTAAWTATGEPTNVTAQWLRCASDAPDTCAMIDGATGPGYKVVAADAGRRLAVRVTAFYGLRTVVRQSQPTLPVPLSSGAFAQSGPTVLLTSGSSAPPLTPGALYLRPFPIVRVKGRVAPRGARITLFRVNAPRGSKVVVRCRRFGCPLRRRSIKAGRIRTLERFLPAGIRITIRVTKPGLIGKYVRLRIRGGSAPKRRDACLMPGDPAPAECPLS